MAFPLREGFFSGARNARVRSGGLERAQAVDMKRLRNHLIGVDQGSVILFSDFDSDGEMWAGSGPRSRRIAVRFSTSFKSAPIVQVSIEMFDMDQRTNQRSDISHENVTPTGFDILFRTWGDTRVARARAGWLAIGELRDENEWDVD